MATMSKVLTDIFYTTLLTSALLSFVISAGIVLISSHIVNISSLLVLLGIQGVAFFISFILISLGLLAMVNDTGNLPTPAFKYVPFHLFNTYLRKGQKKNTIFATVSFWSSMMFWIPALNVFFSIIALVFGLIALYLAYTRPQTHAGAARALFGVLVALMILALTIFAVFLFGFEQIFR